MKLLGDQILHIIQQRPGSVQGHGVLRCDRAQGHDILFLDYFSSENVSSYKSIFRTQVKLLI